MSTKNVHKPISNRIYNKVFKASPITNLILNTGVRIQELHRLINEYDYVKKPDFIDIKTKKSGSFKNRIYLNDKALETINSKELIQYIGKSVKTLQREIDRISIDLGEKFTAHSLRATFATKLLSNGVDLVHIQTLMNHRDISTTSKYIQLNEASLRTAVDTLAGDDYNFEGMTNWELKQEILQLRLRLKRKDI